MPSTEYWTADDVAAFLSIMEAHDCTHLELGELKLARHPKIQPLVGTEDSNEPSDEDILMDPFAGIHKE